VLYGKGGVAAEVMALVDDADGPDLMPYRSSVSLLSAQQDELLYTDSIFQHLE
jgi:hypothetical protein